MREGYKKTEVGVIPEDWEVKYSSDVFNVITDYVANGSFASLNENVIYKDKEDYAVLIRLTDYKNGYKDSFVYVDKNAYEFLEKSKLEPEDIIIANVGAYAGYVFKAPKWNRPMTLGPNAILVRSEEVKDYIYYWLSSEVGQKRIRNIISTTAQPKFNKTDFKRILIPIPPQKEQEKIAEILLTVDFQIDDTEKLIEKSKELKKGLMQKLLTKGIGHSEFKKTEVGEIPFDWEIKTLESIASVIDSLHETPKYIDNGISMIRVVDINGGYIQTTKTVKVSDETYKKFTRKYTPRKGDIIMSRVGSYGLVSYLRDNNKVCLGQNIVVINTDINKKFLFYALSSQYIKNEIDKVTVGSSQKSLSLANIKKLHIVLPTSSEQVNISNILESMDKNIEEYINKLEELKYLKKGLMQQLLTGKIRVNNL